MRLRGFRFYLMRPGSTRWLIAKEAAYGGRVTEPVRRVSPHQPPRPARSKPGEMVGGDRMSPQRHNYAPVYAEHLRRFVGRPVTLVEVGILRGTGLAIWSDLFPRGRIIGLDLDLANFENNRPALESAGAFAIDNVEVHEFDQFDCTPESVATLLRGRQIDILIDDGVHLNETILNTFKAMRPHLRQECVCFIEDNDKVADELKQLAPDFDVFSKGEMTVLSRV